MGIPKGSIRAWGHKGISPGKNRAMEKKPELRRPHKRKEGKTKKSTHGRFIAEAFRFVCKSRKIDPNQVLFTGTQKGIYPKKHGMEKYYAELLRLVFGGSAEAEFFKMLAEKPRAEKKENKKKTQTKKPSEGILLKGKYGIVVLEPRKFRVGEKTLMAGKKKDNANCVVFFDGKTKQPLYTVAPGHQLVFSEKTKHQPKLYLIYDYARAFRKMAQLDNPEKIERELILAFKTFGFE